jgi:hypothetical protein
MSNQAKPGEATPAVDQDDTTEFDTMMEALEIFFHMASCPNHTPAERTKAFELARDAFAAFAYDEDAEVIEGMPVESERVLGDDDGVFTADGPKPGDKVH